MAHSSWIEPLPPQFRLRLCLCSCAHLGSLPRALGAADISLLGSLWRRSWGLHTKAGAGRSPASFPVNATSLAVMQPHPQRAVDGLMAEVSLNWASLCLRRVHNLGGQWSPYVPRPQSVPGETQAQMRGLGQTHASQASRVWVSWHCSQYTADRRLEEWSYSLTVLEPGSPAVGGGQGWLLPRAARKNMFSAVSWLLAVCWSLAFLSLWSHHPHLWLHPHVVFCLSV